MNSKRKILIIIVSVIIIGGLLWVFVVEKNPTLGSASLSWEANTEPDLAGYKIYYGTSPRNGDCPKGGYEKVITIGKRNDYKIEKLESGKTYYFSITSYNADKKESCFSEEMKKDVKLSTIDKFKKLFKK